MTIQKNNIPEVRQENQVPMGWPMPPMQNQIDIQKLVLILAAAALAVLFALNNYQRARREAYIREYHDAVAQLDQEHKKVEQELYDLEERKKARLLCGRGVLVFEVPSQRIVTQAVPLMEEYGFPGMVAIPPDFVPGEGDNLTQEQLEAFYQARRIYFEEELARLEEQVRQIYALYDRYGEALAIPGQEGTE